MRCSIARRQAINYQLGEQRSGELGVSLDKCYNDLPTKADFECNTRGIASYHLLANEEYYGDGSAR